jgi:hypothetical protein
MPRPVRPERKRICHRFIMTLAKQSAILLEAYNKEIIRAEDIVRWTDLIIASMDLPPEWVIELSALNPNNPVEFLSSLQKQASESLSARQRIQIIILAHEAGFLSLYVALQKLFEITIFDDEISLDALDEQLVEALVDWDCQETLEPIAPRLQKKFSALFREYLKDAEEIASVLPWKFKKPE